MNAHDVPAGSSSRAAVEAEHTVDEQGFLHPIRSVSSSSDSSQTPLAAGPVDIRGDESMAHFISSVSRPTSATSRAIQRQHRRQIRSLDGHPSSRPPVTSGRLSQRQSPRRENFFRRASISPNDRDMYNLRRGGTITRGDHPHHAGDAAGSPPGSPHLSPLQVPSMPTKGLLNSLAGAAHYSGMAAVS